MDFQNIVKSFLGPNKCLKFVVEDDEVQAVSCPADYLAILPYQNSLSQFVNSAVQSHHEKHITGTTTLITYIHAFHNAIIESIKQGNDVTEICKNLRYDLECCVKHLESKKYSLIDGLKGRKNDKKDGIYVLSPSMQRILAASRHFTAKCDDENDKIDDSIRKKMKEIVENACHTEKEREMSSLVLDAWVSQVEQRKCSNFHLDVSQIHVTSLLGNPRSNRVISGILIQTNHLNDVFFENTQKQRKCLIITGSLMYDYNHRGYNELIKSNLVLTTDNLSDQRHGSENWRQIVLEKLISMRVNLLLVQGSADDKLLDMCFSSQILVITNIKEKLLHKLSSSLSKPSENYILDCDESNVISDILLEPWTVENIKNSDNFVLVQVRQQIHTLIICSSCTPLADAYEHGVCHLVHRLSAGLTSSIDGGGKAEEECIAHLRSINNESSLLVNVFQHFVQMLRDNCDLSEKRYTVDAFVPKTEAWISALHVVMTLVHTDAIVLVGDENSVWQCIEQCKYNFVGNL